MNHPVETFGFRVEHGGWRAGLLGRHRGVRRRWSSWPRGADVLLCEASFLDGPDLPPDLHLTARQAAEHAARAGVGRLVLTHLVPWNDREPDAGRGGADLRRADRAGHARRDVRRLTAGRLDRPMAV